MKILFISILCLFFFGYSKSQDIHYETKLYPKVKSKLYSLYPKATDVTFTQYLKSDTSQMLSLKCNCKETEYEMALLFDTNGNLLNKDITFHDWKSLPDTIIRYMKKNTSAPIIIDSIIFNNKTIGYTKKKIPLPSIIYYETNYMIKSSNNKGEISYSILMFQSYTNKGGVGTKDNYMLKFKDTGGLILKEFLIPGKL